MKLLLPLGAALAIIGVSSAPVQAGLILNGSFEDPIVPAGSYIDYSGGSTSITNWTVVGVDSAVINTSFSQTGVTFNAEDGNQWIDLAGTTSNSMTSGVTQSVATVVGDAYELTFYVGSSLAPPFFYPATVDLSIDGGDRTSYFNPATPSAMLDWELFTVDFTAANSITNIAFLNGSASNNFETPLDNVQLTDTSSAATPEPSSVAIFTTLTVCFVGYARWRRRKQPATI